MVYGQQHEGAARIKRVRGILCIDGDGQKRAAQRKGQDIGDGMTACGQARETIGQRIARQQGQLKKSHRNDPARRRAADDG